MTWTMRNTFGLTILIKYESKKIIVNIPNKVMGNLKLDERKGN